MRDLARLLASAASHPWYRETRGGERLETWPVLKKADLYLRLEGARGAALGNESLYYSRSGGTTSGLPLFFPTDIVENHVQRRRIARPLRAAGVLGPKSIAINICPIVRMYRAMEIFTEIGERCGATMLPMAALAGDDEVLEIARQFGANTLVGMPSRLVAFARHLRAKDLTLSLPNVLFGGEFMQPGKRKLLESTLGVKRFSALYGSAELGIVGWQSDVGEVPVYRFPRSILHVEILNADESGFGALVGTNLLRKRFPIVRYDTGDVGRIVAHDENEVTIELKGRSADSFLIGDNYHTLDDFASIVSEFAEVQIQIRFDETKMKDVIRFCLVPNDAAPSDEKKAETMRKVQDVLQGHEVMYWTEVAFVAPEELVRGMGTSKTPAIVDYRGR